VNEEDVKKDIKDKLEQWKSILKDLPFGDQDVDTPLNESHMKEVDDRMELFEEIMERVYGKEYVIHWLMNAVFS